MISIARNQDYLRQSARKQYETLSLAPFSLFFHHSDSSCYFNYAIPDAPVVEGCDASLLKLREEFIKRGRKPRFEFIEEFAPGLPAILRAQQFKEEARQQGMLCIPADMRPASPIAGLVMLPLTGASSVGEAKTFLAVQRQGFEEAGEVSDQQAQDFLDGLHPGRAFLAQWHAQPVAAGMVTAPIDGLTELVGVATIPAFRKRGIGAAIVHEALRWAFAQGVEAVYLTAADPRAGQIYARAGFRPCATMLAYCDQDA